MKHILSAVLAILILSPQGAGAQSLDSNWRHTGDDGKWSVKMKGDIDFADDDASVTAMSRDAIIRIRWEEGRKDVRLDIERSGGEIEYDFRENGNKIATASARSRIGELLLKVIRETGVHADRRVARILADGGPDAVFREIENIESGGSTSRYLRQVVAQGDLNRGDLVEVTKVADRRVGSSGDRSRLLIGIAEYYVGDPDAMSAWTAAVRGISSSGDKSRVLIRALQGELDAASMAAILYVTRTVSSSGDKSRVLIAAADQYRNDDEVRRAFFTAAESVSSSGDLSRVLIATLKRADLNDQSMITLFKVARTISSSGDKARVLIAATGYVDGEAMEEAFLDAAETVSSSGDRGRVLSALMRS
jgi:bla regulator protein blaR1